MTFPVPRAQSAPETYIGLGGGLYYIPMGFRSFQGLDAAPTGLFFWANLQILSFICLFFILMLLSLFRFVGSPQDLPSRVSNYILSHKKVSPILASGAPGTLLLPVQSPDQQHGQHLGACQESRLSSTLDLHLNMHWTRTCTLKKPISDAH